MINDAIVSIDSINEDVAVWGGKAVALFKLFNAGFRIPKGIVIPTSYYRQYSQGVLNKESFSEEVTEKCQNIKKDIKNEFIIRSSAIVEGNPQMPYCGVFESYLYDGRSPIINVIRDVWDSAQNSTVFDIIEDRSLVKSIEMAVIVQEVIEGDYSAVIQSYYDTVNGEDRILIEYSNLGIGSIVDGQENSFLAYIYPSNGNVEYYDEKCPQITSHIAKSIIEDCQCGEQVFEGHVEFEAQIRNDSIIYVQARKTV